MGTDNPVEVRRPLPSRYVHRRFHPLVRRVPRKRAEDVTVPPDVPCFVVQRQVALANLVLVWAMAEV